MALSPSIYDDCADMILEKNPHVVGFSAQCTTYPAVIRIAKRLKEAARDTIIMVGGHNSSFVDIRTLEQYPFIDVIVRGEAEKTVLELIDVLEKNQGLREVAGITWRDGSRVVQNDDRELIENLDELPTADYGFLPSFQAYRDACDLPRSIAILEVGRGCPHRCVYCSESLMWRRKTRTYSIERLVREMDHLRNNFGAECFLLAYDQFTANRQFVTDFCDEVIRKGLNGLPWYCISRLDTVDEDLLVHMREAGCESMCYGIDSGSKRTLAFIRKKIDHSVLYRRVVETTNQGIVPTLSYVVGFPEEEQSDIDETLKLALRTGILGNINTLIQMPTVLPGTELQAGYGNKLVREIDTYFALGLEFDNGRRLAGDEALINADPGIFSSFYNVPCRGMDLHSLNSIASFFPLIVNLYPKSFFLLSLKSGLQPSNLFFHWLDWLKKKLDLATPSLSPRICYQHFGPFMRELIEETGTHLYEHINEIEHYETAAIEVGKHDLFDHNFYIDLNYLRELRPVLNDAVLVKDFSYNIPVIIEDMKKGIFREEYPRRHTTLIFTQEDSQLEVVEINNFGKDLIALCDGTESIRSISDRLYLHYGSKMDFEKFHQECLEAARSLGELKVLTVK